MVLSGVGMAGWWFGEGAAFACGERSGVAGGAGMLGAGGGGLLSGYFLRGPKMRRASRRMRATVAPVVILP